MSDVVIKAENLGKKYIIGHHLQNGHNRYTALRDVLTQNARSVWYKTRDLMQGKPIIHGDSFEEVWALKDVSFEVKRGEVIGIIGRNGAGKSTLLKILSRITEPTAGRVTIKGRVASLLEVGTGFHPELTGRENIFLNGAILGMSRAEIKKKFDEIVAFAEVEKFIDTPVKRYSSGMYVRLAFAVAAHLEPEILLVDEVLAVGDAAFQKKCLGKMGEVAKEGRTVLFVSHNMPAITRLCSRAILLNNGLLIQDGSATETTSAYLNGTGENESSGARTWSHEYAPGTDEFKLTSVTLLKEDGELASVVEVEEPLKLRIGYYVTRPNLSFRCAALFFTQAVCAFVSLEPTEQVRKNIGHYYSELHIPANLFSEGEYLINVSVFASRGAKSHYCKIKDVIAFQVFDPLKGSSARGDYASDLGGLLRPLLKWQIKFVGSETTQYMSPTIG